jgi:hypothetical protein
MSTSRKAYAVSLEAPRLEGLRADMLALRAPLERDLEALDEHLARSGDPIRLIPASGRWSGRAGRHEARNRSRNPNPSRLGRNLLVFSERWI